MITACGRRDEAPEITVPTPTVRFQDALAADPLPSQLRIPPRHRRPAGLALAEAVIAITAAMTLIHVGDRPRRSRCRNGRIAGRRAAACLRGASSITPDYDEMIAGVVARPSRSRFRRVRLGTRPVRPVVYAMCGEAVGALFAKSRVDLFAVFDKMFAHFRALDAPVWMISYTEQDQLGLEDTDKRIAGHSDGLDTAERDDRHPVRPRTQLDRG